MSLPTRLDTVTVLPSPDSSEATNGDDDDDVTSPVLFSVAYGHL